MTTSTRSRSMSPGRSLPIRIASLGSTVVRTTYPRGSRAPRTQGPIVGSSSTTKIVGARGSDGFVDGSVLKDDGSGGNKIFHPSKTPAFPRPVPSPLDPKIALATTQDQHRPAD